MAAQPTKRRTSIVWLVVCIFGGLTVLLEVVANLSQVTGFSLKDVLEPQNAEAFEKFARTVHGFVTWPVPFWALLASCFFLWLLLKLRPDQGAVIEEVTESLERQRETTTVYKDWGEAQRKWGELLRTEREQDRQQMTEEAERMAAAFVAMGLELDSSGQVLTMEQRKSRLAGLLLEELAKQTQQLASDIRTEVKSDVANIRSAYFYGRNDWSTYLDSFVAGSMGGEVPKSRHYVQRMVYYIGAMTRHFEAIEFKVRRMGLMPGIVWDVFSKHGEFKEEEFDALVEERFNLAQERKITEFLDSLIEEINRALLEFDSGTSRVDERTDEV